MAPLLAVPQEASSSGPIWALQPSAVILPDGSSAEGQTVLVQDGRILAVGADLELPKGARPWKVEGVLAPGFVDAFSAYGTDQPAREDSRRLSPMLRAFDAIDLSENDGWEELRHAGVTSIHVLPEPSNVQAGWGALVSTGGESSRMIAGRTRQVISTVVSAVGDPAFGPSSLAGAIEVLRDSQPTRIPGIQKHGAISHVDASQGVRAVRNALGDEVASHWMMWGDPASYGGDLKGQLAGIPVPGATAWTPRGLETMKRLHKAGIKLCFGTWSPSGRRTPADLRRAAATFSRLTGDPAAAMAALTSNAAEYAGSTEVGAIEKGRRADLVLWSAHPLDSSARVLAVLIGGEAVHRASAPE